MLKVNSEKVMQDFKALSIKRSDNRAQIEEEARAFAVKRGYDEAQTKEFVAFAQGIENDGLSEEERKTLEVLSRYIADEPAEAVEAVNGEAAI